MGHACESHRVDDIPPSKKRILSEKLRAKLDRFTVSFDYAFSGSIVFISTFVVLRMITDFPSAICAFGGCVSFEPIVVGLGLFSGALLGYVKTS